jgi:anti-sigma factor ChrR (cupin superfamily)
VILDGEQEDEHGRYLSGCFVVNAPGTRHRVTSRSGCVALLIWEQRIQVIAE